MEIYRGGDRPVSPVGLHQQRPRNVYRGVASAEAKERIPGCGPEGIPSSPIFTSVKGGSLIIFFPPSHWETRVRPQYGYKSAGWLGIFPGWRNQKGAYLLFERSIIGFFPFLEGPEAG